MTDVAVRKMTFEEFIRLPEEDSRYELVDGELVPLMPPRLRHGTAQGWLHHYLGESFQGFL